MDVFLFLFFAVIAVACGINLVVQRHPISSALSLIGVMGSLAVLYLLLGAEFLAAAQLIPLNWRRRYQLLLKVQGSVSHNHKRNRGNLSWILSGITMKILTFVSCCIRTP